MKKETKRRYMDQASCDINAAKDRMDRAASILAEAGMDKDAEQLMKMVYRLEAFQNKYEW